MRHIKMSNCNFRTDPPPGPPLMQFTHFAGLKLGPWSKHVSFIKELLVHVKMAALIRLVLLKAGKAPKKKKDSQQGTALCAWTL